MAVADLNGDGHPDVVTADYGDDPDWDFLAHTISVFLGNGDGTFRSAPKVSVGENPLFIAVGDIDGNGTQDLVTAGKTLSVLRNRGDGTFLPKRDYTMGPKPPRSVALGDLNGDGRLDLVSANGATVVVRLAR